MGFFRQRARRNRRPRPDEAGPSRPYDAADLGSLDGDEPRTDDVYFHGDPQDEAMEDEGEVSRVPFIISVAVFAVTAVYFTVQRILNAVRGDDSRRELHPSRAFVLRLPDTPTRKMPGRRGMPSPDLNLSFVVPEDFKLDFIEANKIREEWKRCLCFVDDGCQVVDQLMRAGARCLGKAHTEPIPFNLVECGAETFRNPEKAGTVAGGEYSGCAIIVRASLADFALAVATVGGPRIAAACCGVIGFKPTYGSILLQGISFKSDALDTVAFTVKKHPYLTRIGEMLDLPGMPSWQRDIVSVYFAEDLFKTWIEADGAEMVDAISKAALKWAGEDQGEEVDLGEFLMQCARGWEKFDSEDVYEALSIAANIIAGFELKCKIVKENNGTTDDTSDEARRYHEALDLRRELQTAFKTGIRESKLVILPALLRPPPRRNAPDAEMKQFEREAQKLHALASLVGCPQLVFPVHNKSGDLYSVSLLSLNKTDKELLAISERLIPSTHRMLDAAILRAAHKHDANLHPSPHAAQKLSEGEIEGEKWKETGNKHYRDSDFETAVVAYSEAIRQCPYRANYYSNRAAANLMLGEYEFAEEDCSKALVIDPHNAKALLRRGCARKKLGMCVEAVGDFEKVRLIEPNNRQARIELRELERFFGQV